MKEEPIQRMERFGTRPKNKNFGNRACRFSTAPHWTPRHKYPALDVNRNKCSKKRHKSLQTGDKQQTNCEKTN